MFPGPHFSPYKMSREELDKLAADLRSQNLHDAASSVAHAYGDSLKQDK